MKQLPLTTDSPVLRTDFSDPKAWDAICEEMQGPDTMGAEAFVEFIDDPAFGSISVQQLLAALPPDYHHTFIMVVDKEAIENPEHPVLVVNLYEGSGDQFRAVPSAIPVVQSNLFIANMDFEDFTGAVDADGIFRHF